MLITLVQHRLDYQLRLRFAVPYLSPISKTQVKVVTYLASTPALTQGCASSVSQRPERPRWWERSCCTRVLPSGSGSRPSGGWHTWPCCTPASSPWYYFDTKQRDAERGSSGRSGGSRNKQGRLQAMFVRLPFIYLFIYLFSHLNNCVF